MKDLSKIRLAKDLPNTLLGLRERIWREFSRFLNDSYQIGDEPTESLFYQLLSVVTDNDIIEDEILDFNGALKETLRQAASVWVVDWVSEIEEGTMNCLKTHCPLADTAYISENLDENVTAECVKIDNVDTSVVILIPVDETHSVRVFIVLD